MAGDAASNRQLMAALELPPCDGPKLRSFENRHAPIEWLNELGHIELGEQGYVFKVKIKSRIYALKVVS